MGTIKNDSNPTILPVGPKKPTTELIVYDAKKEKDSD